MDQTNFENIKSFVERAVQTVEESSLFNHLYDNGKKLFKAAEEAGESALHRGAEVGEKAAKELSKGLGLPQLDLNGFEQEAPYHSQGVLKDLLHSARHLFIDDESLTVKIHKHVEDKMSPAERKKFDNETKSLDEYHARVLAWGMQMTMNPGPYPELPHTPMHREISRRSEEIEKAITDHVRGKMSPSDIKRLDAQMLDYNEKYEQASRLHNPIGTGEGFKPLPQPGNAIKDYFDRIAEATEEYLKK